MVHRTVAGGRTGRRRAALATALAGLLLAGAGLVPAVASDHAAGHGQPSGKGRAKPKSVKAARKKTADTHDHLVVRMARPGDDEEGRARKEGRPQAPHRSGGEVRAD